MLKLIRRTTLAINVLLIVGLALPIFALIGMFLSVNFQLWAFQRMPDFVLSMLQQAELRDGIETGTDPRELKRLYLKLSDMSAHASDAVTVKEVHIVFAEFDETGTGGGEAEGSISATKSIGVDVTRPRQAAMVIVPNRPVLLNVTAADQQPVARIAVEGRHPFDVRGADHGLLAGFRVDAFGALGSATPDDFPGNGSAGRRLCELAKRWRNFFDVSSSDIRIWQAKNPENITLKSRRIETSGGSNVRLWRGSLNCLNR